MVDLHIIAVAMKKGDQIVMAGKPSRHHDLVRMIGDLGQEPSSFEQGFVLGCGEFVERRRAGEIAVATGQVAKLHVPPNLYSEDLW